MSKIAELTSRYSRPGQLDAILLRPGRREQAAFVDHVDVTLEGLTGDRGRAGKRAVTLIQSEHLPVIAALAGQGSIDPRDLRRNLVVAGLNLSSFRGGRLRIGAVVLELTVPCHPCSRMEEVLGNGGYTAMRGHGGMCAAVIEGGRIRVGDMVIPV